MNTMKRALTLKAKSLIAHAIADVTTVIADEFEGGDRLDEHLQKVIFSCQITLRHLYQALTYIIDDGERCGTVTDSGALIAALNLARQFGELCSDEEGNLDHSWLDRLAVANTHITQARDLIELPLRDDDTTG